LVFALTLGTGVVSSSDARGLGGGGGGGEGIANDEGGGAIGSGVISAVEPRPIGGGGGGGGEGARELAGGGGGPPVRDKAGGPGGRLMAPPGAERPSSVFCRAIDGGGGTREPGGGGTLGTPDIGRDFLVASPSKMSRSELALSLIAICFPL
jgi:hypothetical protein